MLAGGAAVQPVLRSVPGVERPALGHHAARAPGRGEDLRRLLRGDGRYGALLDRLARIDVLVLDDWGLAAVGDGERQELYELLDDRHERRSTIVTSQLPVDTWHRVIGDPSLADAILDRLTSNAYRIELDGPSIRPKRLTQPSLTAEETPQ